MAAASSAPVYAPFSTFIGSGVVGGRMPSYATMGREGAKAVNALLDGVPPDKLSLPAAIPAELQVDWRQVRKWEISAKAIPHDAIVHFREPTFWEAYRDDLIVIAAVILIQFALIIALLIERRRRRRTASALEESESHMSLASSAARLSMWIWDITRDKLWSTTQLRQGAGLSKVSPTQFEEVLASVHPADRAEFDRAVRRAVANGEELDTEFRILDAGGAVRWIAARGRAEKDGGMAGDA
jgi:PAS domain-containing protein